MSGSADCGERSPLATDEEPPGPLDLTPAILSTDLRYDGNGSADSQRGFGPLGGAFAAAKPIAGRIGFPAPSTADEAPPVEAPASRSLAFLRATTTVGTRSFRRLHFADVSNRE